MSPRREFGSITKISKDIYRLRWMEDMPDGRQRRSETVRGTRRDAALRLAEIGARVKGERYGGAPTLQQVRDEWWPEATKSLRKRSVEDYDRVWRVKIKPRFGDTPVDKVTPAAIQAWLLGMTLSISKSAKNVLRQILNHAVVFGYVQSNACDVRFRMPEAKREMPKTVWSMEELVELYEDVAQGTYLDVPFILQAFGGCRVGEALSPKVDEVHEVEVSGVRMAAFTVVRTVGRDGSYGPPKTEASEAAVFVPDPWASIVLRRRDENAAAGLTWLCDDGTCRPMTLHRIEEAWRRAVKASGREQVPMRNLRNSYGTNVHWGLNVPIEKASKLMRHKGTAMTLKHYDRPHDDMKAAVVAEAFGQFSREVGTN